MKNLGRIFSLFFILQVTTSLFLENNWICGENHGMIYWVFVGGNNHAAQVVSGNFQLTLSIPCGPSFFFLENICDYSTWFSIYARLHTHFLYRFSQQLSRVLWAKFLNRKLTKVCAKLSFPNWHIRRIFVPTLAYWEAFKSKVSILFSLFQKWVECVQVKGTFGRGVTGLREDDYVWVTSCNSEGYIVTCLARTVKWCENPTEVGRGLSLIHIWRCRRRG